MQPDIKNVLFKTGRIKMKLKTPLNNEEIKKLHAGDKVELSGVIYTARDAAHARLKKLIENNKELPFELKGQVIYYVGPAPAKPGYPVGSAGPTTSYRMDPFAPVLIDNGLKGMIGKGPRSNIVRDSIIKNIAVYFAATGGAAALIAKKIKKAEIIAYPELGPEAIRKLEVEDLPLIVINDIYGNDQYEKGKDKYRKYK